jgi:hypothetical protein
MGVKMGRVQTEMAILSPMQEPLHTKQKVYFPSVLKLR